MIMKGRSPTVLLSCLVALSACEGGDDESTPEEQRQQVRDQGSYCCTHDGVPSPPSCRALPGSVYLEDFSMVDASGRGDACGWIWDGK